VRLPGTFMRTFNEAYIPLWDERMTSFSVRNRTHFLGDNYEYFAQSLPIM